MLTKHPTPVLAAEQFPFNADKHRPCVFNAGVVKLASGEYLMAFRNDYDCVDGAKFGGSNLGLARSRDGIDWSADPEPFLTIEMVREQWAEYYPARLMPHELKRVYDPRITQIDGVFIFCFAVDTMHGVRGAVARTTDFKEFELLSCTAPDNRNMVLFPETVDGRYVRLERPFPIYGRGKPEAFEIWSSKSPDLRHWGDTRLVLGSEEVPYANSKIGPAAPPIRTDRGWLTTIHAVEKVDYDLQAWHPDWRKIYHGGLILLDLEDPAKVIGMAGQPLIVPDQPYEIDGFRGSVIFPCGMILEDTGEVKIYYGAADTCVALATAKLDDLLATIEPMPQPSQA